MTIRRAIYAAYVVLVLGIIMISAVYYFDNRFEPRYGDGNPTLLIQRLSGDPQCIENYNMANSSCMEGWDREGRLWTGLAAAGLIATVGMMTWEGRRWLKRHR